MIFSPFPSYSLRNSVESSVPALSVPHNIVPHKQEKTSNFFYNSCDRPSMDRGPFFTMIVRTSYKTSAAALRSR